MTCQSITLFRGTLTIRALVMGDGALCYGALEIVGLLLLLLLLFFPRKNDGGKKLRKVERGLKWKTSPGGPQRLLLLLLLLLEQI